MKNENNILIAMAGFSLLLSSVAIAGTSAAEQSQRINVATPEMTQTLTLEKMIQENTEKKRMADVEKYAKITTIAGDRKNELAKKRDEVTNAYKTWRDLKSAAETSQNTSPKNFKAVEAAAQAYSQANKAFVELQKDILAKNGILSAEANARIVVNLIPDTVDTFNTAPATAAGSK